jgi:outer membrane protein assembly factor BamB
MRAGHVMGERLLLAVVTALLAVAGGLAIGAEAPMADPVDPTGGMIGWWRSIGPLDGPAPVRLGDLLIAADRDGSLVALDPVTGRPAWHAGLPGAVTALAGHSGDGVAAADDTGTLAWFGTDGALLWQARLDAGITTLAVGDDRVVAVGDSSVFMVDRRDGSRLWQVDLGGTVLAAPLLVGDHVVVGSGEAVVALVAGTGAVAWSTVLGAPVSAGVVPVGEVLVAADWDGDLVALDPVTGAIGWRSRLPSGVEVDLAAGDGAIVLVEASGSVALVDASTGASLWRHDATDGWAAFSGPRLADGAAWVVDSDGMLHVLEALDGSERWSYGVGLGDRAPLVTDGLVHVQSLDGPLVTVGRVEDPRRPRRPGDVAMPGMAPEAASMAGGGPDATGWRPGPGPDGSPTVLWRATLGAEVSGGLVSDGDLVTGGGLESVLYGFDAATGTLRWRFATADWIMYPPALLVDGVVVGDESSHVYGVDRADGTGRWEATLDAPVGAPIVTDGVRAYVLTRARTLVALDTATGVTAWTLPDASAPAVADGTAWVMTGTGVRALDAGTGAVRWEQPSDFPTPFRPTVSGGRVYVPNGDAILVLDAATGASEPFVLVGGRTGMTVGDGVAVLADGGAVTGVDLATGAVRWTSVPLSSEFVPVTPVLAGDAAYLATGDLSGRVIAVDAHDGTERWRFDTGVQQLVTTPVVVGHRVFLSVGPTILALGDAGAAASPAATASGPGPSTAGSPPPVGRARTSVMAGGDPGRSGMEPGPAPRDGVAERWRSRLPGTIRGGVASTRDLLAVVTDDGWLLALDPGTGEERWRAPIEVDRGATPVIDGGLVYAADGGLAAFDAATGQLRWRIDGVATSDPLLAGGLVLASSPNGLFAIDVGGARGLEAWRYTPEALADGFADLTRPALDGGRAFVVLPALRGGAGTVWALDATSGDVLWQRDDLEAVTAPTAAGGVVVVGTRGDGLVSLDGATGATRSEVDLGSRPVSPPSTDSERWYVGTDDGVLVAIDRDGEVRWVFGTGDELAAQPSVAGDTVVIASYDGFVYGVDRITGGERWRFETGRETEGAPSVMDGVATVAAGPEVVAIEGGP